MVSLKEFNTEQDAFKYLAKFPENQFISPSCSAANQVYTKWCREDYSESPFTRDNLWAHGMYNIWLYQVFLCKVNENGVTYVFDKDYVLENAAVFREKKEEKRYRAWERWYPEPPESQRNIPLKKKTYYKPHVCRVPKNVRIRTMDYPDEMLAYEGEVYPVNVQPESCDRWEEKYTFKFWHHADHVCWKNNKKNKKQWMKNAS